MVRIVMCDISRILREKRFAFTVALFVLVAALNLVENLQYRGNLFSSGKWGLFLFSTLLGRNLFIYFAPLLASLPFSSIPRNEQQNGVAKHIIFKIGVMKYCCSRILSAFILGFIVTVAGLSMVLVLSFLLANKNVALYRDRLYEAVWNEPFTGETRTLDSHIQRLRKKLGWNEHIKTVFRIGYRLEM